MRSVRGWTAVWVLGWSLGCGWLKGGDDADPGDDDDDTVPTVPGDDDDDDTTPTDPTGTGPDTTATDPASPSILSISTNTDRITDDDLLRVTAIVTDPDGIDDLIGGELLSESGASYGAFSTGAQEGAYEIELTWQDLDAVAEISFDDGEVSRDVLARFYDQAGHTAQSVVTFTLYCDEGAACDGRCMNLHGTDVDNCGQCGNVCQDEPGLFEATCDAGSCVVAAACTDQVQADCDQVCNAAGHGPCAVAWTPQWGDATGVTSFSQNQCDLEAQPAWNCTDPLRSFGDGARSGLCFCQE